MVTTTERVKEILDSSPARNKDKLEKQQEYYKRLTEKGVAKKQTYNLKPVSAI